MEFRPQLTGGDSGKLSLPDTKDSLLLGLLTGPRNHSAPQGTAVPGADRYPSSMGHRRCRGRRIDPSLPPCVPEASAPLRRQPITALAVSVVACGAGALARSPSANAFAGPPAKSTRSPFQQMAIFYWPPRVSPACVAKPYCGTSRPADASTLCEGHRDTLYGAALSPDGTLAATAGYDRRIKLWNTRTGKLLRTLEGHNGPVHGIAFSPDGTVLASAGGDSAVKLWQVASGQRLDTFGQPTGEQFITAFTPDSQYVVAAGADKQIRLWRWISKTKPAINPLARVRFAHEDEITDLALSRDGRFLASASADRTVKVWTRPPG